MDRVEFNIQNVCRACKIEAEHMLCIYQKNIICENYKLTLAEMLMECTSLKISPTDGMPREICSKCMEQLKLAFSFKKQCEDTDTFLRQYLLSQTVIKSEDSQHNVLEDESVDIKDPEDDQIKLEPVDIGVENTVLKRKRGRPKRNNDTTTTLDKGLKVIFDNIGNDVPENSQFETSQRGRLRKSVVKYEEDDFSDSYDFAEVDASELLNDATLNSSDPDWTVSDNENMKKDSTNEQNIESDNEHEPDQLSENDEKSSDILKTNLSSTLRRKRGRPRKNSTSDQVLNAKVFVCSKCNQKFKSKLFLKQHENSHDDDNPFMCEICPQKFARRDQLIQHTKSHLNELNHDCEICGQKLETIEQLAKHKFSKHTATPKVQTKKADKEKHKCEICGKLFSSIKHRDNHVYLAHNKIYYCKTCTLPFRGREAFYIHNTRSNECSKKYLCPDCGARFSATSALKVHIRRHRGEKPFKCQYCEKGFSRKFDLITHETRHRGEKNHLCTICGKGFNRRHMLTIHMRTHTGEKPYKCTYCDAAFTQNNDLKTHIRRHTGERFICDLCNEKFLMHYLLSKHKRIVHGINIPPAKPILQRIHAPSSVIQTNNN